MKGTRLVDISAEFSTLFSYNAYGVVNSMLAKAYANIPTMPTEKILTYVKAVQVGKTKLPTWKYFINSAKEELIKRGENADEILKGLT